MKKFFILLILLIISAPVFAGQYEDALRTGEPVFLYLYTKDCNFCKKFNDNFEKIVQNYKHSYKFVKIDAYTPYGQLLVDDFRIMYLPFVVLADSKKHYLISVPPYCLMDNACLDKEMKNFLK